MFCFSKAVVLFSPNIRVKDSQCYGALQVFLFQWFWLGCYLCPKPIGLTVLSSQQGLCTTSLTDSQVQTLRPCSDDEISVKPHSAQKSWRNPSNSLVFVEYN